MQDRRGEKNRKLHCLFNKPMRLGRKKNYHRNDIFDTSSKKPPPQKNGKKTDCIQDMEELSQ